MSAEVYARHVVVGGGGGSPALAAMACNPNASANRAKECGRQTAPPQNTKRAPGTNLHQPDTRGHTWTWNQRDPTPVVDTRAVKKHPPHRETLQTWTRCHIQCVQCSWPGQPPTPTLVRTDADADRTAHHSGGRRYAHKDHSPWA